MRAKRDDPREELRLASVHTRYLMSGSVIITPAMISFIRGSSLEGNGNLNLL